jgi:hypothetical protein
MNEIQTATALNRIPPPADRVAVAVGTGPLAGTESQPSKLAEALATARERCRAVAKSSENTFHKYKYASADAIIAEATEAMNGTGLSLVPLSKRVRTVSVGTFAYHEYDLRFLLIHTSGESIPLEFSWPICVDKGRPLDRATATADTTSLAYALRGLLLMPRVDPHDEMDSRDDRPAEPPPPVIEPAPQTATTPAPPPSPSAEIITPAQYDEICRLINEAGADHSKFIAHYAIQGVSKLPAVHFNDARNRLLAKLKPTSEQADRIDNLCAELKLDTAAATRRLRDFIPGATDFAELTRLQLNVVIDQLAKSLAVQKSRAPKEQK